VSSDLQMQCAGKHARVAVSLLLVLLLSLSASDLSVNAVLKGQSNGTLNLSGDWGVEYAQDDEAYAITPVNGQAIAMITGYTKSIGSGGADVWLICTLQSTFPLGNIVMDGKNWTKTYGGPRDDAAKAIVATSDGAFALAGYTKSYGAGGSDMYLLKVDLNGNLLWNRTFGEALDEAANDLVQTADGGYLLVGYRDFGTSSQSTWVVKTDAQGQMEWNQTCSGLAANSIAKTSDGGYILSLEQNNAFSLMKLDSAGQTQWTKTYPGPTEDAESRSAIQTSSGGYAVAGWTLTNSTSYSAWLIKTDNAGDVEWSQIYAGWGAYDLIPTLEGGYALTGDRHFLLITDSVGGVLWSRSYDGVSEDNKVFTRAYGLIEQGPLLFRMVGVQQSYGYYSRGLGGQLVRVTMRDSDDVKPTVITIVSPEAKTYTDGTVPITVVTDKPILWMAYAIDNGGNVTFKGNTTITEFPNGSHNLTIYVGDLDHNYAASKPVLFQVTGGNSAPTTITTNLVQNGTYTASSVSLTWSSSRPLLWARYRLDNESSAHGLGESVALMGLNNGVHTLEISAEDILGASVAVDSLTFYVNQTKSPWITTPTSIPSLPNETPGMFYQNSTTSEAPTNTPNPTADPMPAYQQPADMAPEPQSTAGKENIVYIVVGAAAVAISVAVLVLVLKLRKTETQRNSCSRFK
jgi:hypothetical protein